MIGNNRCLGGFLVGIFLTGIYNASAVEVYTTAAMEGKNGTDLTLRCTFRTNAPIGKLLTVSWNFRPQAGGSDEYVFYYHDEPYPPESGRFKGRAVWSGDVSRKDASITIRDLKFTDNGTFYCHVKNPPDVYGTVGEIHLRVVQKVSMSEFYILGVAIGGATAAIIILVAITASIQYCRKRRRENELSRYGEDSTDGKEMEKLNSDKKDPILDA
ncbi:myelin protein zero-like protein 2b [Latimeria chalumnae]